METDARAPGRAPSAARRSVVPVLAFIAGGAALLWLLGGVLDVLLLVFAGGLLALFLHGCGAWIAKRLHLPERACIAAVCIALLGLASAPRIARGQPPSKDAVPLSP